MTHDPLCPMVFGDCCRCDLIANVRRDERINSLRIRVRELKPYANAYCDGERDMLAKCIAAVEALYVNDDDPDWDWPIKAAEGVLRSLGPIKDLTDEEADAYCEALQEKP